MPAQPVAQSKVYVLLSEPHTAPKGVCGCGQSHGGGGSGVGTNGTPATQH